MAAPSVENSNALLVTVVGPVRVPEPAVEEPVACVSPGAPDVAKDIRSHRFVKNLAGYRCQACPCIPSSPGWGNARGDAGRPAAGLFCGKAGPHTV